MESGVERRPAGRLLHVPPPPPPIDLAGWVRWARSRGLSDGTIQAYSRELRKLAEVVDVDHAQALALRAVLETSTGKASTVNRRVAAWASYYRWLVRTEQRADNPTEVLDRPKVRRGLPRPLEDFEAFLAKLDPMMQAIAVLLWETGLRISEACAITVDVPAPDELIVMGKGSKERWIPLSERAREALDELGGRVSLTPRAIQRRFRDAAPGVTPHRLRHSFATDLIERDVALEVAQQLLGHSSPSTTMIYAKVSRRRLREAVDRRPRAT